jgi:hypothetical protein
LSWTRPPMKGRANEHAVIGGFTDWKRGRAIVERKLVEQRDYVMWRDQLSGAGRGGKHGGGRSKTNSGQREMVLPSFDPGHEVIHRWRKALVNVNWWDVNVGVRLNTNSKVRADLRGPLSMAEAEAETQIKHQQVARWRTASLSASQRWDADPFFDAPSCQARRSASASAMESIERRSARDALSLPPWAPRIRRSDIRRRAQEGDG